MDLSVVDGMAGFAALINSLLMWPTIRAVKRIAEDHGARLRALESRRKKACR